jgi:RimJ/RimL family protein N-acetyltransferase
VHPDRIDCGVCALRRWRRSDRDALLRHADNRNVWRNLRDLFPHPYTAEAADRWLAFNDSPPAGVNVYAIDVGGEAVGSISTRRQGDVEDCGAEIGYWLGEAFWGRGIMTAAVRETTRVSLAEPDLYRLFATVFPWNPASMRVLEKCGYRREGILERSAVKDGVLIDRALYAITRQPSLPRQPIAS